MGLFGAADGWNLSNIKVVLISMVAVLMMSEKLSTLGLRKIKLFWNKGYDIVMSVHDVTNKILSRELNYTVDLVMWPKLGNSRSSMREVIITSILWGFHQKNEFFEGCSWFKLNNLGLALGMVLKFYTSDARVKT